MVRLYDACTTGKTLSGTKSNTLDTITDMRSTNPVDMPPMSRCDECNEKGPMDSLRDGLCPRCYDE
jgi:hypothetical protein